MILDCPACHARFLVADAMIPPTGRSVRCGKCTHQWHVASPLPPEALAEALAALAQVNAMGDTPPTQPEIKPLAPGANVPAIKKPAMRAKPFMIAAPLIAASWLALALVAYYPTWMESPVFGGIYSALGIKTTQGLVFSDVTMEREQEGSKTRFVIAGSVTNHAKDARFVPSVRVTLKDKAGKAIWGREYPVNSEIAAGSLYPFRITNVETSFASAVSTIVVDLGHPLELVMR